MSANPAIKAEAKILGAFTHADFARKVVADQYRGESLAIRVLYVQARLKGAVCCARIVDAWDTADGLEMFKLDLLSPVRGSASVPSRNVRQCQGIDGKCSCAPADPVLDARAESRGPACGDTGGARSAPDGNHGETPSETAQ